MKILRLILGDQLNSTHSWFSKVDENVVYCLFEMRQETDYVTHHIKKIAGFFAAMRNFGDDLKNKHHHVIYLKINDEKNTQNLTQNLSQLFSENSIQKFEYQSPDEYRLDKQLSDFCNEINIASDVFSTEHFYTERTDLETFFKGKKQFLIENFYREMRKKYQILILSEIAGGHLLQFKFFGFALLVLLALFHRS